MNRDDQPLAKGDFDKSIKALEATLVGGMNQMLETLIRHIDGVEDTLVTKIDRLETKVDNTTDDLAQRVGKLEKQQA